MARKPADKQYGKHSFKGVRYDKNGNPIYTSDTLSDDEKKAMGWRYSKKHGLHGQISDPSKLQTESKQIIRLTESELKRVITESVKKVLKENNFWNGNGLGYGMELHNRRQARSFPMRSEDHDANNARIAELEMGGIRGMIRKVYELHQRYEHMYKQTTITHRFDDERFVKLEEEMQKVRDEAKNILEKLSTHLDDERVISLYNDPKLQNWIRSITRKRLTPSNNYKSFESLTNEVREELVYNKITPKVALMRLMKLGHSKEDAIKLVRLTLQMMRGEQ